MELITETGAISENTSDQKDKNHLGRMMVILSADELAAAIHKACGMDETKMPVTKFSLETARKALSILPPLYYEPRNGG